jgi:hypothetical protein
MGEKKKVYRLLVGKPEGRRPLEICFAAKLVP